MKVFLKYCGGCNPRYDREEFAKKLIQTRTDQEFTFIPSGDQDASVLICGCPSACADKADGASPYGTCLVWDVNSIEDVDSFLDKATVLKNIK